MERPHCGLEQLFRNHLLNQRSTEDVRTWLPELSERFEDGECREVTCMCFSHPGEELWREDLPRRALLDAGRAGGKSLLDVRQPAGVNRQRQTFCVRFGGDGAEGAE